MVDEEGLKIQAITYGRGAAERVAALLSVLLKTGILFLTAFHFEKIKCSNQQ